MRLKKRNRPMKHRGAKAPKVQLRYYQEESVQAAWDSMRTKENPVIVLPTGAGKSLVIAQLCMDAINKFDGRVIILAHRKELLGQNADEIMELTGMPVGIYSAGLNRRDTEEKIILAGIQSVFRKAAEFGQRNLIIIDEAHLIPVDDDKSETMYGKFIHDILRYNNGKSFLVGLTATPFRTGLGEITDYDLFDSICYEAEVGRLIEEGYLCRLTNKASSVHINSDQLSIVRGEFSSSQMAEAFDEITGSAVNEIISRCADRKSILIFTAGVKNAREVHRMMEEKTGEAVGLITGESLPQARDETIQKFKSGELRWLVNVNVLTTGFNATRTDCVAILRSTTSAGLFAQMIGRGLRLHEGKEDCLILDFGENLQRHGAIDDPKFGRRRSSRKGDGEAPMKKCGCGALSPASAIKCYSCGNEFERNQDPTYQRAPDETADILMEANYGEQWFTVAETRWRFNPPSRGKEIPTLRVEYSIKLDPEATGDLSSIFQIKQYIGIEHDGYFGRKARGFWVNVCAEPFPPDVQEAIEAMQDGMVRKPSRIKAKKKGRFWEVTDMEFDQPIPSPDKVQKTLIKDLPF